MFRLRAEYRILSQSTGKGPENRWGLQGMGWQGKILGSGWRVGMVVWRSSKVSVHSIGPALLQRRQKGAWVLQCGACTVVGRVWSRRCQEGQELRRRTLSICKLHLTSLYMPAWLPMSTLCHPYLLLDPRVFFKAIQNYTGITVCLIHLRELWKLSLERCTFFCCCIWLC